MRCLNFALQQGYTVEWDADVSNMGFSAGNGIAIVPEKDWKDRSVAERESAFKNWEAEKQVSQEYRQQLFDQQVTTDDHLMHIVGMLDEAHGGDFYAVKNSWGEISDLKGYVNVSDSYMRLNTISFTVHKSALPADVLKRLNVQTESSTSGPVMRPSAPAPANNTAQPAVTPAKIQPKAKTVAPQAAPAKAGNSSNN
jgi:bleomycin hydrolase